MKKNKLIHPLLGLILLLVVLSCGKTVEHGQTQSQQLPPDPGITLYSFSSRFGHFTLKRYQDNAAPVQDTTPPGSSQPPAPPPPPGSSQPPAPPVVTPPAPPVSTPPPPPPSLLDTAVTRTDTPAVPLPQVPVNSCSYAPTYGDSIIFPQPNNGQDYIVLPVNSPGTGKYFSWPIGMVLDSITGAINLTKSETGMRYYIGFIKSGTTDTCLNQLIVGGAAYMDSVYVLDNGATKAYPYYDANPYMPPVCNGTGPGSGCTFDVTGSAAGQKVIVDKNTGVIDLKKTLNGTGLLSLGGAFGLLPQDGQSITTRIYYRLNDPSNNALQHIDVQIAYFAQKSLLGVGLLGSITGALDSILSGNVISTSVNPRPPLLVIVRHN
jgi:hypothetical protein